MAKIDESKKSIDTCFVIMPFGGYFDSYYSDIYKPAIETVGLCAKRADDLYRPSTIIQDIWTYTKEAKLVIADLTDKNPNVFYELGLAHALAKPAILITNSMMDIPFDLRALRVIEYDKNLPNWGQILKAKIESAIKETIDSPVNSVLPAFMDTNDIAKNKIAISEKDFLELKRDYELLKSEVRSDRRVVITNNTNENRDSLNRRVYIEKGYPDYFRNEKNEIVDNKIRLNENGFIINK